MISALYKKSQGGRSNEKAALARPVHTGRGRRPKGVDAVLMQLAGLDVVIVKEQFIEHQPVRFLALAP